MTSALNNFRVVLVEPAKSLNVGSVARAMMNLGFRDLRLVAPQGYDRQTAEVTACWATPILDELTIHDDFADAIADCESVVGLSERVGKNPAIYAALPQWVQTVAERSPRKTALVFGPEDSGLRQEHLNQCARVVSIPSTAEFPSFNLAQSVLLVLWEIARAALPEPAPTEERRPTWNDFYQLDRLLDAVMHDGGFIRQGSPGPAPDMVKNLFRRLDLNPHEIGLLLSLFGRIETTLRRQSPPA